MQETDLYPNKQPHLTDEEVFSKIWLNPRKVFKFINAYQYDKYLYVLLILVGIANAFYKNSDQDISSFLACIYIIIIGGLLGLIGNYVYAAIISFTGTWIDGKATTKEVLRVLAFANIPLILTIFIPLARYILRGDGNFSDDLETSNSLTNMIENVLLITNAILGLWAFAIFIIGVAEVQKFTIIKAILNTILPILILVVPLFLILIVIKE